MGAYSPDDSGFLLLCHNKQMLPGNKIFMSINLQTFIYGLNNVLVAMPLVKTEPVTEQ